jgi:hypothetical protein
MFTIDFDYRLIVISPKAIKNLDSKDKSDLTPFGGFIYDPPKSIVQGVFEVPITKEEVSPAEIKEYVISQLKIMGEEITNYKKAIDKKCAHLSVYYNPSNPDHEFITEACDSIFGSTTGEITYKMYTDALDFSMKLDRFIALRAVETGGTI